MLVLDTNVISELLRSQPNPGVEVWLEQQSATSVFTTSVSRAEILYGIAILPVGQRRSALLSAATLMFEEDFKGRILPFDCDAADLYATIAAQRRAIGRPIAFADAQIAAIALSRGGRLATRNVDDFTDCGLDIINPWNPKI